MGFAGLSLMSLGSVGLGFSAVTQHIGAAVACGGVVITGAIAEMMRQQRQQGPGVAVDTSTPFEENELSEDTGMSPSVESTPLLGGAQDLPSVRAGAASSTKPSVAVASGGPGLIVDDPSTGPLRGIDHNASRTVPSIVGDDFDEDMTGPGPAVAQQRLGTLVQPADYEITDRTPIVSSHYGDSEDTIGHEVVAQEFEATRDRLPWERDRAGEDSVGEPDFLVQGVRSDHVVDAWRGSRQGPHTGSVPTDSAPQTDLNVAAAHEVFDGDVAAAERAASARAAAGTGDDLSPLPGLDRLRQSSALGGPGQDTKPSWVAGEDLRDSSAQDLAHMPAPAPESGPITLPPHLSRPDSPAPGRRVPAVPSGAPRRFLPGGLSEMSVFDRAPSTGGHVVEFSDVGQVPVSEQSALVDLDSDIDREAGDAATVSAAASPTAGSEPDVTVGSVSDGLEIIEPATDGVRAADAPDTATASASAESATLGLDAPVTTANVALASSWQAMRQRIDEAEWAERNAERAESSETAAKPETRTSAVEIPTSAVDTSAGSTAPGVQTDYFGASLGDDEDAPMSSTTADSTAGRTADGARADYSPRPNDTYGTDSSRAMAGGSLETPQVDRSSPFTRVDAAARENSNASQRSPFTGSQPAVPAATSDSPTLSTRRPTTDAVTLSSNTYSSTDFPKPEAGSPAVVDVSDSAGELSWSSSTPDPQQTPGADPVEPPNAHLGQSTTAAPLDAAKADVVLPNPQPVSGQHAQARPTGPVFRAADIDDNTELPRADNSVFSASPSHHSEHVTTDVRNAAVPVPDSSLSTGPLWSSTLGSSDETALDADEANAVAPVGAPGRSHYDHESQATGPEALASQRRAARRAKTRRRGRGDSVFATQGTDESPGLEVSEADETVTEPRAPRGPAPRTDQVDQSYSKMKERIEALRKSTSTFDD